MLLTDSTFELIVTVGLAPDTSMTTSSAGAGDRCQCSSCWPRPRSRWWPMSTKPLPGVAVIPAFPRWEANRGCGADASHCFQILPRVDEVSSTCHDPLLLEMQDVDPRETELRLFPRRKRSCEAGFANSFSHRWRSLDRVRSRRLQ